MNCHSERSEESQKIKCFSQALYFFVLLFILGACNPNVLEKEAPAINEIKSGEKFTIILPENHDEKLLWKLSENHNKSVIDNMGAVWHGNDKGVYFRFTASNSGTDTLLFTQYKTQEITMERDSVKSVKYIIKVTE
jgi:predicted secreted protein